MKAAYACAALLVAATLTPAASASITGSATRCRPTQMSCNETAVLQLRPTKDLASNPAMLFIGIIKLENGRPNPAVSGWFNGKTWVTGNVAPAFTGIIPTRNATVSIPGGVCGLVKKAGGSGDFGLFAGWGKVSEIDTSDVAALQDEFRDAPPELQAEVKAMIAERAKVAKSLSGPKMQVPYALSNMQQGGTYWQIQSYSCGA